MIKGLEYLAQKAERARIARPGEEEACGGSYMEVLEGGTGL